MFESWEGFTLSIRMTESTRKFSKTQGENWKNLRHQPCSASGTNSIPASWKRMQSRRLEMRRDSKQCMVAWWNPTNLRDSEQNLCNPKHMKIALLGKDVLRWHITMWCTSLFRCHKPWRLRMQRLHWTRNGRSSKQFQHGIWKVKSRKEVLQEAQRDKMRVHFASLMDMCHLKKCRARTQIAEV